MKIKIKEDEPNDVCVSMRYYRELKKITKKSTKKTKNKKLQKIKISLNNHNKKRTNAAPVIDL